MAAQLLAKGSYHVLLGSRSKEKGEAALDSLRSRNLPGTVELLVLDVTDDNTISRAAEQVEKTHGRIDMLVNDAGIAAATPPLRQQMRDAFDVNATGPAVVTETFAPLLQKSTAAKPRILNISSGAGSIARRTDTSSPMYNYQHVQYRASKAALNMVTVCQWVEYGPRIKVFAYCPGFTQSNFSDMNKAENGAKSTEEGVRPAMDILEGKRDDEAGLFLHEGGLYPW